MGAAQLSTGCRKHDHDDDRAGGAAWRNFALPQLACSPRCVHAVDRAAQDRGSVNPPPLPPLAHPDDPGDAGQGIVRPQDRARETRNAHHRLLRQGLPRRRRGAADQRPDLAGDAAFAQPQLGPSEAGAIPGTAGRAGAEDRLARPPGRATCRSRAAARCAPAMPATRSASTPTSGSRPCPTASSRGWSGRKCRRP